MIAEESSEAAELDSYHRDVNPSFGAARGAFVVADQTPLAHQPAEGAFHHPAAGQHLESAHVIGTFDHLHFQLGADALDPLREGRAAVAAIDQSRRNQVNQTSPRPSNTCAPSRSGVLAGVTATPRIRPSVSTSRWRLRPLIRLAAS